MNIDMLCILNIYLQECPYCYKDLRHSKYNST